MPNIFGYNMLQDGDLSVTELKKVNPAAIVIILEWERAKRIKKAMPETIVIYRHWPDDNIHMRMTPEQWVNEHARFAVDGLVLQAGNEPDPNDLRGLARWYANIMDIAGGRGIGVAVGAFSTGRPERDKYGELEEMWRALDRWHDLHIWLPHEYFDMSVDKAMREHIGRYMFGFAACDRLGLKRPRTVIGELGLAKDYHPHKGWKQAGISELQYADELEKAARFYQQNGVTGMCVFSLGGIGGWEAFDIKNARNLIGRFQTGGALPASSTAPAASTTAAPTQPAQPAAPAATASTAPAPAAGENMLKNSELKGFPTPPMTFENNGTTGYIEWPNDWTWFAREQTGYKSAESYHRDNGYEISAGSRLWEAGYEQPVQVRRGQTYTLRARFTPALYRYDSNPLQPQYLEWRFAIRGEGDTKINSDWVSGPVEKLQQQQEFSYTFQAPRDGLLTVRFSGRGTAWDYIYKFTVHRVEMMLGVPATTPAPAAPSAPTPPSATTPVTTPPVTTIAFPTAGWQKAFASSPYEFSRVREQPSTKAAEVGRILKAEIAVEIAPDARTADLDGTPNKWFAIRTATWRGWIREDVITYRLDTPPAPPAPPAPPVATAPDAPAVPAATTTTSSAATTVAVAPVGAREAAPAPEPVAPPPPERKPHTVQFTFMGTDEEVERLRAAIAAAPDAFSEFVETYGNV